MLKNDFRGLTCNVYFKRAGGVKCFSFIIDLYFAYSSLLGGMNMEERYVNINWDRGFISYSDKVPESAILEQGYRRTTDEELKIDVFKRSISKQLKKDIKHHEKELKEAVNTAGKCIKQYKHGAPFAIYDFIACSGYIKNTQYELDTLKRVEKELEGL